MSLNDYNSPYNARYIADDLYRQNRNDGWKHAEVITRLHQQAIQRWRRAFFLSNLVGAFAAFVIGLMIGGAYL